MNTILELDKQNEQATALAVPYRSAEDRKEIYLKYLIVSALQKQLKYVYMTDSLFFGRKFYSATRVFDFYIHNNLFDIIILQPSSNKLLFNVKQNDFHSNIYGYVVARIDENARNAKILGYFCAKDFKNVVKYGGVILSELKPVDDFADVDIMESQLTLSEVSDRFFGLLSMFCDDDIKDDDFSELACLLYNSAELREVFSEVGRFEKICSEMKTNASLLEDDMLAVLSSRKEKIDEVDEAYNLDDLALLADSTEAPKTINDVDSLIDIEDIAMASAGISAIAKELGEDVVKTEVAAATEVVKNTVDAVDNSLQEKLNQLKDDDDILDPDENLEQGNLTLDNDIIDMSGDIDFELKEDENMSLDNNESLDDILGELVELDSLSGLGDSNSDAALRDSQAVSKLSAEFNKLKNPDAEQIDDRLKDFDSNPVDGFNASRQEAFAENLEGRNKDSQGGALPERIEGLPNNQDENIEDFAFDASMLDELETMAFEEDIAESIGAKNTESSAQEEISQEAQVEPENIELEEQEPEMNVEFAQIEELQAEAIQEQTYEAQEEQQDEETQEIVYEQTDSQQEEQYENGEQQQEEENETDSTDTQLYEQEEDQEYVIEEISSESEYSDALDVQEPQIVEEVEQEPAEQEPEEQENQENEEPQDYVAENVESESETAEEQYTESVSETEPDAEPEQIAETAENADDELMSILSNYSGVEHKVEDSELMEILGVSQDEVAAFASYGNVADTDDVPSEVAAETEQLSDTQDSYIAAVESEIQNATAAMSKDTVSDIPSEAEAQTNKDLQFLYNKKIEEGSDNLVDENLVNLSIKAQARTKKIGIAVAALVVAVFLGGTISFSLLKSSDNKVATADNSNIQDESNYESQMPQDNTGMPPVAEDDMSYGAGNSYPEMPPVSNAPVANPPVVNAPVASTGDTKIVSSLSKQAGAAPVILKSVAWQIPSSAVSDVVFNKYLQIAGKNIKLNLTSDLLGTDDFAYNNKMRISMKLRNNSPVKDIKIIESSGSENVNNVVLRSIKQTLKYINSPVMSTPSDEREVILVIYL